jgi:hypothetical protein
MIDSYEANSLPGGRLALIVFWLGSALLLLSAMLILYAWAAPQTLRLGSEAWYVPAIGLASVSVSLALRRNKVWPLQLGAALCLMAIIALAGLFVFGSHVSFGP